jgi:hypothetical protein
MKEVDQLAEWADSLVEFAQHDHNDDGDDSEDGSHLDFLYSRKFDLESELDYADEEDKEHIQSELDDINDEIESLGGLSEDDGMQSNNSVGIPENFISMSPQAVAEGLDDSQRARLDDLISQYSDSVDPDAYYGLDDEYPDSDEVIAQIRQEFGDKIADTVEAGASKMHFPRHDNTFDHDPLQRKMSPRVTKSGKINKQDNDYMKREIKRRMNYTSGGPKGVLPEQGVAEGMPTSSLTSRYMDDPTHPSYKSTTSPKKEKTLQDILKDSDFAALQIWAHNNPNNSLVKGASAAGDAAANNIKKQLGLAGKMSYEIPAGVMMNKIHPVTTKAMFDYLRTHVKPGMAEDLDANQKRVGQLGPTEKVGKKGAVGKLVGANENFINTVDQAVTTEGVDELAVIKRLLGK